MDDFVKLSRPVQPQVKVDPSPQPPAADGFNYPTLRLLNKQARVHLSSPIVPTPSVYRRLFSVANSRGWFAAVTSTGIIFSLLSDLRARMKDAKDGVESTYTPQRNLSVAEIGQPCIIAFGCGDSRFFVGFEQGHIAVYDTTPLLSRGTQDVQPLNVFRGQAALPIRQIVPNPGFDNSLSDLCAVLHGGGIVQLFNGSLESQGGWSGEGEANPEAVSWSPKGKQIAIGLRSGDIFAYIPTNKSSIFRHVPPTAKGTLISLTWLPPGHTFRAIYALPSEEIVDHIITVDVKTPTAKYFAVNHPFPLPDRPSWQYTVMLLRWDEQSSVPDEPRTLVLVGDAASTDLEVLGGIGFKWYQQSQENPLSLPLDSNMEDTMLLSLELDLTDAENKAPIVCAYLNDGTIQLWYVEHTSPYPGIVTPQPSDAFVMSTTPPPPSAISIDEQKEPAIETSSSSSFVQPTKLDGKTPFASSFGSNTFGQSTFGVSASSAFNTPTAFGQTTQSVLSDSTTQAASFGSTGFSSFASTSPAAFVSGSFGFKPSGESSNLLVPQPAEAITREASMSDDTSSFGGLSLGGDSTDTTSKPTKIGIFGSFGAPTEPSGFAPSASASMAGGLVAPATGFGAFKNMQMSQSTSGEQAGSFAISGPERPNLVSPAFRNPSFGQPSFGQSVFGKSALTPSAPSGFGAFAPNGIAKASGPQTGGFSSFTNTSGGFASFAKSATLFGTTRTSDQAASPLGSGISQDGSSFSTTHTGQAANVGTAAHPSASTTPPQTPTRTSDPRSPSSSPEAIPQSSTATPVKPVMTGGAFASLVSTPSVIQPASGFGALSATPKESPFAIRSGTQPSSFSAFGGSTTTPLSTPVKPANTLSFGIPSQFGMQPATLASKAVTSGAFSAFSGSGTGFGAFTGSSQSFTELLKSSGDLAKEPISVFPPITQTNKAVSQGSQEDTKVKDTEPAVDNTESPSAVPKPSTTALNESEGEEEPETSEGESESEEEEEGGDTEEEEVNLSESSGSGGSDDDLEEVEVGEVEEIEEEEPSSDMPKEPKNVPLPLSPSPSTSPLTPDTSVTSGPPAPTPSPKALFSPAPSPPESPPGSTSAASSIKLGLGRPSTRPARSSPLANAPLSRDGEEDESSTQPSGITQDSSPSRAPAHTVPGEQSILPPIQKGTEATTGSFFGASNKPGAYGTIEPVNSSTLSFGISQQYPTKPDVPSLNPFGFGVKQPKVEEDDKERLKLVPAGVNAFSGEQKPLPQTNEPFKLGAQVTSSVSNVGGVPFATTMTIKPASPLQPHSTTQDTLFSLGSGLGSTGISTSSYQALRTSKPTIPVPTNLSGLTPSAKFAPFKPMGMGTATEFQSLEGTSDQGMQNACSRIVNELSDELVELRKLAAEAAQKRVELTQTRASSRFHPDTADPARWGTFDNSHFKQVLSKYYQELDELRSVKDQLKSGMRELQSSMLKANTRREEIARFTKANSDNEFSRMLKARTLGPEHLETQTHLRRSIRAMRDRVQKLEYHLQASKRKVSEMTSGKPSIRAPSLDTINRTYRNIDIAIDQQSEDISKLAARIARLSVKAPAQKISDRDPRLPDHVPKRAYNITPHVAVTTAAALNAEQSAHKLKQALLNMRKEPLLNTTAVSAPLPPASFDLPHKREEKSKPSSTSVPSQFGMSVLPPATPPRFPPSSSPSPWDLPPDNFNLNTTSPPLRRGAGGGSRQHISVPLKRSAGSTPTTPSTTFNWGPLPTYNMKPATTLLGEKLGPSTTTLPGFEAFMKKP
ncbi:hypothetical protein AX16_002341 [Volvariella volvacea WC 439]|nr:hypothetical protein AX16_002341 [Volvariella volvacea WC 439]